MLSKVIRRVPKMDKVKVKIPARLRRVTSESGSGIGVEGGDAVVYRCTVPDCRRHGVLYAGSHATGRVECCKVEKTAIRTVSSFAMAQECMLCSEQASGGQEEEDRKR